MELNLADHVTEVPSTISDWLLMPEKRYQVESAGSRRRQSDRETMLSPSPSIALMAFFDVHWVHRLDDLSGTAAVKPSAEVGESPAK
jgi:hypothetical protein